MTGPFNSTSAPVPYGTALRFNGLGAVDLSGDTNDLYPDTAPKPTGVVGTVFDWYQNFGLEPDGKTVYDWVDPTTALSRQKMLELWPRSNTIHAALSYPLTQAKWNIKPGKADPAHAKWFADMFAADTNQNGLKQPMQLVLHQAIGMCALHGKAFFELSTQIVDGKTFWREIAFRPPTTCALRRDSRTGELAGFQQLPTWVGTNLPNLGNKGEALKFDMAHSFLPLRGLDRDPVNGHADMQVVFQSWQTIQKVMVLLGFFMERQAIPKMVAESQDGADALALAQAVAKTKASGVIPTELTKKQAVHVLDTAGQGHTVFLDFVRFMEAAAANAILAGFLDLSNNQGRGSGGAYALSRDQSDFFMMTRQAAANELAEQVRWGLLAPLTLWNWGPDAVVPLFQFEPLAEADQAPTLGALQTLAPQSSQLAPEFWGELQLKAAGYLDMDVDKVAASIDEKRKQAEDMAKQMGQNMAGQQVAGAHAGVGQAANMVANGPPKPFVQVPKIAPRPTGGGGGGMIGAPARIGVPTMIGKPE